MNITLAIDEELLERARDLAARRGVSLNQLIRDFLEVETGLKNGRARVGELEELWSSSAGRSGGVRFSRDETYAERNR
jgi:hypothetical protein